VLALVTEATGVPPEWFVARARGTAEIVAARHLAMYLLRVVCSLQFAEIANLLRRDASTVAHACAVIENRRDDAEFEALVSRLEARLETPSWEDCELKYAQA
jgi:chromosomal replication initiation ATPase DnaA